MLDLEFRRRRTLGDIENLQQQCRAREASIVVAKLIATVVSMVWNYLLYDSLVFRKPQR